MREIITKRLRSFYVDIPALRPGTAGAYAFALVSVVVATALRLALDPFVEGAQFVTFYPAIVVTTLISGFGAGFFSAVLSTAAADFFVLSPRWSFYPETPADLADLLLFGPLASYLVIIIARMRFAIEREQEAESKNSLQLALDAAQLGWWQYDPIRMLISGDMRSKDIFDVSADNIPIEDFVTSRLHPHDTKGVCAAFQAALDPAGQKPCAIQYQVQRRGEVCWVEAHGLAHFEGAGRDRRAISLVGTIADVTERIEHEERLRLLMREVNHRARNMLGVVDAIARQTVAGSPEDYVTRFSERIWALAVYQDLLVRSEWKGVGIEELARAQLSHFAAVVGSRVTMQGPTLRLNPASAQAIGLALHELVANAGKYGVLSTDDGHVDISWGTDGETFTMSWTERDGPLVSQPERRGFGSTVMETMTERTVDGKVDLDYGPLGATWRLRCPAANVLQ